MNSSIRIIKELMQNIHQPNFTKTQKNGVVKNSTDEAIILYLIFIILNSLKHFNDFIRSM
jgi:hypothetical protein